MVAKIDRLTHEQDLMIPEYIRKWNHISKTTEEMNKTEVLELLHLVYKSEGLEPPARVFWESDPISGARRVAQLLFQSEGNTTYNEQELKVRARKELYNANYGYHEHALMSFYDFLKNGCDLDVLKDMQPLLDLHSKAGWFWTFDDTAVITEKVLVHKTDASDRLHCTDGPAMVTRGGTKIYAVEGISVSEHVVMDPGSITIEEIDREDNAEVKRILIQQLGEEGYIEKSGLQPEQEDRFGKLYRSRGLFGNENLPDLVMVRVVDGSVKADGTRRVYFITVPPTIKSAREAVAWSFNLKSDQYSPAVET